MFDSDYIFYGKHAHYAKYLCKDRGQEKDDRANVFQREVDVLMAAPLIGIIKNRFVSENDNSSEFKTDKSTIQLATISAERKKLMKIYRAVILANPNDEYSDKDKISQAFRFDQETDANNPNMSIFNGYVRGGLEELYEIFKDDINIVSKNKKYQQNKEIIDLINELDEDNSWLDK